MNNIKIAQLFSLGGLDFFFFFRLERTYRSIDQNIFFSPSILSFKGLWIFTLYLLPARLERQEKVAARTAERHCWLWWTMSRSVWGRNRETFVLLGSMWPAASGWPEQLHLWVYFSGFSSRCWLNHLCHHLSHFSPVIVRDKKRRNSYE